MTMEEIPVRTLRNDGGRVLDRVTKGTSMTVTRDGIPVAELRPVRRRSLPAAEIIARARLAPKIDYEKFRADVDNYLDTEI